MQSSSGAFEFPQHYQFPPMYTIQPNPETRAKQMQLWQDIVLAYCEHKRMTRMSVGSAAQSDLFQNQSIDRKLDTSQILQILEHMVRAGHAEWEDGSKISCLILYRKTTEWAQVIHSWAVANGLVGQVVPVMDLFDGELSDSTPFEGLDIAVLNRALQHLEKQGKAVIFKGISTTEDGVKFSA